MTENKNIELNDEMMAKATGGWGEPEDPKYEAGGRVSLKFGNENGAVTTVIGTIISIESTDLSTDILTDLDGTTAFAELGRIVKEEPDNIRTVLYRKWYGDYISKMEAKMIIKEYGSEFDKYQAVFDEET